jgi:protein-S-isoprenylcysteine O-methyltransferase Ste14
MNTAAVLLSLLNLGLIGALPRVFFRPGRLNFDWWLTAAPFMIAASALLGGIGGIVEPISGSGGAALPGMLLSTASIFMIRSTLDAHREPLALWHQKDDEPRVLVTHGLYSRVRHPFYSSFIVALMGAALVVPHWLTAAAVGAGFLRLNQTAALEERKLLASGVGREYRAYLRRTGRFVPTLRNQGESRLREASSSTRESI